MLICLKFIGVFQVRNDLIRVSPILPQLLQMILVANEREVLTKCHDEVLHIIDDALLYQFLVLVLISYKQLFRVDIVQQILVLEHHNGGISLQLVWNSFLEIVG